MASISSSFDSKKFIRDLERDIKKSAEADIKKHPEKVLNEHRGERVNGHCTHCGNTEIVIHRDGKGCCSQCGQSSKVDVDVRWK
ncbi:MAG: hypothetical protein RR975_13700 [Clostridia bacterium]